MTNDQLLELTLTVLAALGAFVVDTSTPPGSLPPS